MAGIAGPNQKAVKPVYLFRTDGTGKVSDMEKNAGRVHEINEASPGSYTRWPGVTPAAIRGDGSGANIPAFWR